MAVDLNNLTSHNILVRENHMTELLPNILNVMRKKKQKTWVFLLLKQTTNSGVRCNKQSLVMNIKTDYKPAAADKDTPPFHISGVFTHTLSLCKLPEMNPEQ